jgi:hypothetical protein
MVDQDNMYLMSTQWVIAKLLKASCERGLRSSASSILGHTLT